MSLPPDEVPDNLSADQYQKLSTLYGLMGKSRQSMEAMNRAAQAAPAPPATPGREPSEEEQFRLGMQFGQRLAQSLLDIIASQTKEGESESSQSGSGEKQPAKSNPLADLEPQLKQLGVSQSKIDQMVSELRNALTAASKPQAPPPREVPEGLTANEYYDLGKEYKLIGWTEQARDALALAIELDPEGDIGNHAQAFLRSKLPHYPVPLVAEQTNIIGFNQMVAGDLVAAKRTFQQLIVDYPDFEWPYGNLGSLLIRGGNLQAAEEILGKALAINPNYVNARLHLSRAKMLASDIAGARRCLNEVLKIDPDDPTISGLFQTLEMIESWG